MAQLRQFNGGKSTRITPHLIALNEGVVYTNIDNSATTLKPVKDNLYETQNFGVNSSFYYFSGNWIAKAYPTSYVEFQEKLYYSDSVGIPKKTNNGTTFFNLGIVMPSSKLSTTYNGTPILPTTDPNYVAPSTMQYCYTYYNSNDGTESSPSTYSDELQYISNNIFISNFVASSDPQVTNIKLYRLGGPYTEMVLVATLSPSTTSYTDTLADLSIPGNVLNSYTAGQAPAELSHLIEHNSMLFGIKKDKLYYSDVAFVNNWSPFFFIDFDAQITGLGSTQNGLLVYTKDKTYIVTGTNPAALSKVLLHGSQGCVNHKTIKYVDNNLIWLSIDGLCSSNGGTVQIITMDKLGPLSYTAISAEMWDNQYYLFHTTGTLVADFRFGSLIFKDLSVIANGSWYSSQFDKLYYVTTSGALYSLFKGSGTLPYTFKSGKIAEDAVTVIKNYKVFYVYISGTATLKIYLDGALVTTASLVNGFNEVKVPVTTKHAYYVEFEITGTGELIELEYKVEGRQNGR